MSTTTPLETSASNNNVVKDESTAFEYPHADLILRSCDSCDFRVTKLYIVHSSPVLGELIRGSSISSDIANDKNSLPVAQLSESKVILRSLFTFIFPVSPALPSTIEAIMERLSVAQKYQMMSALAHIRGSIACLDLPFTSPETAFRVYSLAQKYGLRQEALLAARVITLNFSMTLEDLEDKLDITSGAALYQLWMYHEKIRTVLASDLAEFRESGASGTLTGSNCVASSPSLIPRWLEEYIESIGRSPNLFDPLEFDIARTRHINHDKCTSTCLTSQTIWTFRKALTTVVYGSIEKAEPSLFLAPERDGSNHDEPKKGARKVSFVPGPLDIPDANLILRSADLVNFRVHKSVLAMASPFFKNLLSIPSDDEVIDGLPVVRVSEDAQLLNILLCRLYPVLPVMPSSNDQGFSLLAACQKYGMTSIQPHIHLNCRSLGTDPFRAYAIASREKLTGEMERAAGYTLDHPMTFETLGKRLQLFEGWALRDLVRFRRRCRDNVVAFLEPYLEDRAGPSNIWVGCPDSTRHSRSSGDATNQ
ncbi:hypothetical protein BGW80DRAFT_1251359 [Lactifluus volemus]|nr:hypothetical protein BGW80DRAFT_1251359 [Lactifluus volemus]